MSIRTETIVDHAAVPQCLTSVARHDKLVGTVVVVVVLRECMATTAVELRDGAVPRCVDVKHAVNVKHDTRVVFRAERRNGTTEKLQPTGCVAYTPTRPGERP